jgi:hypothetical protein
MERGRHRQARSSNGGGGVEQRIYGESSGNTPPASPIRRGMKNNDSKRNKRIADAYGTSMIKSKKNRDRSRSHSRDPAQRGNENNNKNEKPSQRRRSDSREPRKPNAQRQNSPPRPSGGRRNSQLGNVATVDTNTNTSTRGTSEKGSNNAGRKKHGITASMSGAPKHKSAEDHILAATSNSRTINQTETDLDYSSLQNYIEELKHKMAGSGSTVSSVSVHQLSKVKKRIFNAMTHEQKIAAMLKRGQYKPSSNLMKGGMPSRKKHVSTKKKVEPKTFRKKSAGNVYNQQMLRPNGNGKNQWGDWLDDFEAESFKWFERQATFCHPGPASGKMLRAFNNYGKKRILCLFVFFFIIL